MNRLTYEWNGMGTQETKSTLHNNLLYTTGDTESQRREGMYSKKYFGITSIHLEKKFKFLSHT